MQRWRGFAVVVSEVPCDRSAVLPHVRCPWRERGSQVGAFHHNRDLRVEIWYSVVEDDLCVYLESVEVIHRPQQSFPGFDI